MRTRAGRISRRGVPGRRNDALIVLDHAVLDPDPVTERAARTFVRTPAGGALGPRRRVPARPVVNAQVTARHVRDQLVVPLQYSIDHQLRLDPACDDTAEGRAKRGNLEAQHAQRPVDGGANLPLTGGVADQQARERPDLHRHPVVPWSLDPRVLVVGMQERVRRLGSCVLRVGLAVEGVLRRAVSLAVREPGVRDVLADALFVEREDMRQIAVRDDPARNPK